MSEQVRERLDRLADAAPGGRLDPDEVWASGRRRQAVRLLASVACLFVVAGLGAAALPVVDRFQQQYTSAGPTDLRLPDRIRQPGAFEPTFPRAAGPLVAVGLGDRGGFWSSEPAWWGVSGVSGASRFLDLPDAAVSSDTMPALSPDGRHLAYWITGEVTDEPVSLLGVPVVGLAVMDLVTGTSIRQKTETPHGLAVGALAWAGDRLHWSAGPISDVSATGDSWGYSLVGRTWDVVSDERVELERVASRTWSDGGELGPAPGGFVSLGRRRVFWTTSEGTRSIPFELADGLDGSLWSPVAISTDGNRLAGIHEQQGAERVALAAHPLLAGEIGPEGVVVRPVGDVRPNTVQGWRSPGEVVVTVRDDDGTEAVSVDVTTGEATILSVLEGNPPTFAAGAWSAEPIAAPDAPWAPDPRLVALGLGVVLWILWRVVTKVRRRRASA